MSASTSLTRVTAHFRVNTPKNKSEVDVVVEGVRYVTGKQLKDGIAEMVGVHPHHFRVVFNKGEVEDHLTLASQGIFGEKCDVYCSMRMAWYLMMMPCRE